MTVVSAPARVKLALAEDPLEAAVAAPWIGPLVALGGRASRYSYKLGSDRQLVVVLSIPQRDFAAALLGCGWVMNSAAPLLPAPMDVLRALEPGTPVRVVTHNEIVADRFVNIDESKEPARIRLTASQWLASAIDAAAVIHSELDGPIRMRRPNPVKVAQIARLDDAWDTRLAAPEADLAIIGTQKWLLEDMNAYLTREGESIVPDLQLPEVVKVGAPQLAHERTGGPGTIADLLLPEGKRRATWFTRLYASARLPDHLPLPKDIRAAILDGSGAVKYVAEIEAPVVVCILDRSVADETAAEMVIQLRNSRGEPISLKEDLRWRPPAGIEALAFTVPL